MWGLRSLSMNINLVSNIQYFPTVMINIKHSCCELALVILVNKIFQRFMHCWKSQLTPRNILKGKQLNLCTFWRCGEIG